MSCFFITNREIIDAGTDTERIREDGAEHAGDNLRFGSYDISSRQFTLFPEPQKKKDLIYEGTQNLPESDLAGSARFFRVIYDLMSATTAKFKKNDLLFFIHGFNTDLDGVRSAFDHLQKAYVELESSPIAHLVIFTWPGRNPIIPLHYLDDAKDAARSGQALARADDKLLQFMREFFRDGSTTPCDRKIHLMAHSMGNLVLKNFIQSLTETHGVMQHFKEIVLVAADVAYNVFEPGQAFADLIDLGERVHIYYHERDSVLDISKYTKNLNNRLGRYGRRDRESGGKDVFDCDVTKIKADIHTDPVHDKMNHWYYYNSTKVVEDIAGVLRGCKSNFRV